MNVLLRAGPVVVALAEARHLFRAFEGRDPDQVRNFAAGLGWTGTVHSAEQVHGTGILVAGQTGCGDAFLLGAGEAAVVRHADCWPVVVADPVRARTVVAHCGWKGALGGLAGKSVRTLLAEGSRRSDLVATIGPGIEAASFEVGPEVARMFPSAFHAKTSWGTRSIDLGAFLLQDLSRSGVVPHRIVQDRRDTFRDPALHSFRRDGAHSGRMVSLCLVHALV